MSGEPTRQGKNYNRAKYINSAGIAPGYLTGRKAFRARGQTKGKSNPLLGACKSRANATGPLLRPLIPISKMTAQERKQFKKQIRKMAQQYGTTETEV